MATRETRADRGIRRGRTVTSRLVNELVFARQSAGLSQRDLAHLVGSSQVAISRLERLTTLDRVRLVDLSAIASILGLELAANLYPVGEPIRDKGHQALIGRFRGMLSPAWRVAAEVPLPTAGDRRAWDLLLRIPAQLVGVEAETRIRDVQAFVRRVRQRELDGGADVVIIVLADTATNRRLVAQLLEALGPRYATEPRRILTALRSGQPVPGSGVVFA